MSTCQNAHTYNKYPESLEEQPSQQDEHVSHSQANHLSTKRDRSLQNRLPLLADQRLGNNDVEFFNLGVERAISKPPRYPLRFPRLRGLHPDSDTRDLAGAQALLLPVPN